MVRRIIPLLFLLSVIHSQIALPTFQAVHTPQTAEASSLYDFTSHTFTNCGATGREGPTLANCKSSYDVSWEDDTDYFNVPSDAGIQYWTVPQTATYTIEVWGAQGGNTSSATAGLGARMKGDFTISSGTVLKIIVGQQGSGNTYDGGGGGGTFVVQKTGSNATDITALIIAGAGGGSNTYSGDDNGAPGSTGTAGTHGLNNTSGTPGDDGNGASGSYSSCGGGLLTNGEAAGWSTNTNGGGYAFVNGGMGGTRIYREESIGGFGGGGSAHGYYCIGGAGGGGYSGGTGSSSYCNSGGGGGSYNSGSNQSNSGGVREGHGQVIITKN